MEAQQDGRRAVHAPLSGPASGAAELVRSAVRKLAVGGAWTTSKQASLAK
jgi:hypothetical protein